MLKILNYLIGQGVATIKSDRTMDDDARGMPTLTEKPCQGGRCNACSEMCPTEAIKVIGEDKARLSLDLGACIGCSLCIDNCPTGTIAENRSYNLAVKNRDTLVLTNDPSLKRGNADKKPNQKSKTTGFRNSLHARVVSTGCSACDLEIGASGNPVFDIERFGVHVVASPRHADALMVTGPVAKGMQAALKRCYGAMAEPKVVMAVGTCAISGGVHRNGYAEANGVDKILPVDVYIPGCPPHPLTIIHGVRLAMGQVEE